MRIKTQFIICLVAFTAVLIIIAASVVITEQQTSFLTSRQTISNKIEQAASRLNSISIDYFLYQEDLQLSKWNSTLSALSRDLENLNLNNTQQQTLATNVANDLQNLNAQFEDVITYLMASQRNVSVRIDPAFQFRWSNMALQSQTLASDASQLSQSINNQVHQANLTNTLLILSLVGTFGAFLLTIYLLVFRKTLKSVAGLQRGIVTIGSGNLDYKIEIKGQNEITELSDAFNRMTSNLKTVTASKTELEKAQAALRASEQRWATTLSSIGDAVIAVDISGNIVFMNWMAEELTGWTFAEASGESVKKIFDIVNEQSRLRIEDPVAKVLEKGIMAELANHTVLIRKDGTDLPIEDSGAPIVDKDGKTTGVVLIFRDITERKKTDDAMKRMNEELEERVQMRTRQVSIERQRLYNILETLPAYVILLDKDYRSPFANKVFRERFGVSQKRCYEFLFNRDLPCENCETYKVLKTNSPHQWEWTGPDNHNYAVYDYPFLESDGSMLILEMGIDITERKIAEQKARESVAKLQDSERLAAIGATAGMVGHDIRNPLQAMVYDVYFAKKELNKMADSKPKESAIESLDEIERNIDYINKIVQDLQDYARPITPVPNDVNVENICQEVFLRNGVPKNIEVSCQADKNVNFIADAVLIKRIITNLITNAVQAMPEGGKLDVRVYQEGKDTILSVEDTGIGIPLEARAKLFTPMFTTKSKGQGFGLAVVKRLTETLGGTVTFESEMGKGTKFILRFPPPKS
jgi:PAS domain S-box-containing protein